MAEIRQALISLTTILKCMWLRHGDTQNAQKAFQNMMAIAQRMASEDPENTEAQQDLWISFSQISTVEIRRNYKPTARQHLEQALAIARVLAVNPQNERAQKDLKFLQNKLADLEENPG